APAGMVHTWPTTAPDEKIAQAPRITTKASVPIDGTLASLSRSSPVTIAVFGHYGNENIGDEAIIEASIHNIRRRLPAARIVCLSLRPFDTEARHGLKTYPIRDTGDEGVTRRAEMQS